MSAMSSHQPVGCDECDFDWTVGFDQAVEVVARSPDRYAELFAHVDPGPAGDAAGVWSPRQYLWHVVDVLRFGAERLWALGVDPDAGVMAWDEKAMAAVRERSPLSVAVGLHALRTTVTEWLTAATDTPADVIAVHPEFGPMDRLHMARRNAHEVWHHEHDIRNGLGSA
jgi:hypothetical protein